MALSPDIHDREHRKFVETTAGKTAVRVEMDSDIQIGAVEIKNATDETRAVVKTDGTDNALVVVQNTIPQTKVEIVTPLGTTCEDETNTAVLVGIKGSVAYNNTNDVFRNQIFGFANNGTTMQNLNVATIDAATVFNWTERGFYPIAVSDVNNYNYPLHTDENTAALLVCPTDTTGVKQLFTASGEVKVGLLKPDGTNTLPSGDIEARGIFVNLGTNNDVTVTGTVTANAGTNLNTSALALETTATSIKTAVELIDNAISGTEMQVDVVASLPAGDNQIGGIFVNGGDGAKNDTSLTLTTAATAYANTAPATPHLLIVHNASDTDVYFRFTTGTTLGILLAIGTSLAMDMGASEVLYFYCPTAAGKILNYGTRSNY